MALLELNQACGMSSLFHISAPLVTVDILSFLPFFFLYLFHLDIIEYVNVDQLFIRIVSIACST